MTASKQTNFGGPPPISEGGVELVWLPRAQPNQQTRASPAKSADKSELEENRYYKQLANLTTQGIGSCVDPVEGRGG